MSGRSGRRAGRITLAIGLTLMLAVVCVWVLYGRDISPPDESDFQTSDGLVADATNAFFDLDFEPDAIRGTERDEDIEDDWELFDYVEAYDLRFPLRQADDEDAELGAFDPSVEWDAEVVRGIVDERATYLDTLERALEKKEFVVRLDDPSDQYSLVEWRDLAFLLRLRIRLHLVRNDVKAAADDALLLARFGHRIAYSGPYLWLLVGIGIESQGFEDIWRILALADTPKEQCEEIRDRLRSFAFDRERLREIWAKEYQWATLLIESELGDAWFYHPNRTRARLLRAYRIQRDWMQSPHWTPPSGEGTIAELRTTGVANWLNWAGEQACALLLTEPSPGLWTRDFDLRATRLVAALRLYDLEHDGLPETLDALVPKFIESVPRDPFAATGGLRYSREEREISSVGADLDLDHFRSKPFVRSLPEW